ncbi:hypothetical protein BCV70DRAFT_19416 [Testicularia cyperi]|uniref:Uncharacterized protein n=1 Tax=Testicularia cyperi TaxID=1882483 RepID=A0A317Y0G3_9BASI|nr:hypothetical protein BCV70DRAFT_19416 [Testicularia cyperi]
MRCFQGSVAADNSKSCLYIPKDISQGAMPSDSPARLSKSLQSYKKNKTDECIHCHKIWPCRSVRQHRTSPIDDDIDGFRLEHQHTDMIKRTSVRPSRSQGQASQSRDSMVIEGGSSTTRGMRSRRARSSSEQAKGQTGGVQKREGRRLRGESGKGPETGATRRIL